MKRHGQSQPHRPRSKGQRIPYLASLYRRGTLSGEISLAGLEVQSLIMILSGSLYAEASKGVSDGGRRTGHATGNAEHMRMANRITAKRLFDHWHKAITENGLPLGPIMEVLEHDASLGLSDRRHRLRHGTTKRLLIKGLGLFIETKRAGLLTQYKEPY